MPSVWRLSQRFICEVIPLGESFDLRQGVQKRSLVLARACIGTSPRIH